MNNFVNAIPKEGRGYVILAMQDLRIQIPEVER